MTRTYTPIPRDATMQTLERMLAKAEAEIERLHKLLISIRKAMVIQGSNQHITDWTNIIVAIDAARKT